MNYIPNYMVKSGINAPLFAGVSAPILSLADSAIPRGVAVLANGRCVWWICPVSDDDAQQQRQRTAEAILGQLGHEVFVGSAEAFADFAYAQVQP